MKDSVLLCISTLLGASNMYSKMFDLKNPNGEPIFETISINLACEACVRAGKPEQCTHKSSELPRWISSQNVETIKILLEDSPELLMRESLGINAETTTRAFLEEHVDAFVKRSPSSFHVMKHIYTAVDPAGGGASAFAICTIGQTINGTVLVSCSPAHMTCRVTQVTTKFRGS